jgi:hypothetical protein
MVEFNIPFPYEQTPIQDIPEERFIQLTPPVQQLRRAPLHQDDEVTEGKSLGPRQGVLRHEMV